MPKFVTLGYGDEAGYDRTAPEVRKAAHARDRELVEHGALVGIARTPVQVRNPDAAGVLTQNTAFMSSPLPVAGFAIIEAADLAEAIAMVARTPCAVAHGVVEVWPLEPPKL
ncbi:MAG TPA: YciI family protein [Rhizomicrobium sp.]|nr:YciI family protein [Rhizomicrobium sp.]